MVRIRICSLNISLGLGRIINTVMNLSTKCRVRKCMSGLSIHVTRHQTGFLSPLTLVHKQGESDICFLAK